MCMISLVAAMDEKRGIGKDNKLLFRIGEDLKRFRSLTIGHPVIMGRKTYKSIGKALPGRTNIVVTRNTNFQMQGCHVCHSLEEAIEYAASLDPEEVFVIGGGELYRQALPLAGRLYLTLVHASRVADTFFPDYSAFTRIISKEEKKLDGLHVVFLTLGR